jgi:hypothetical protein
MIVRKLRLQRGWTQELFKPGDTPMPNNSPITADEENAIQFLGPNWEKKQVEKRLGRPL